MQLFHSAPSLKSGCIFLQRHAPPQVFSLSNGRETCPPLHSQLRVDLGGTLFNTGGFSRRDTYPPTPFPL